MRRMATVALAGGIAGTLAFLVDLARAALLFGPLFDPTAAQLALLAFAWLPMVVGGAAAGLALSLLLPRRTASVLGHALGGAMARRSAVSLACLCVALTVGGIAWPRDAASGVGAATEKPPAGRFPDVLWVVIDTLRADTLYGSGHTFPRTPALARLGANALVFTDAEAGSGWTPPSVASMLSGLHAARLDPRRQDLPEKFRTIAERLRASGYRTAAFVDNVILEPRKGFAQGFDVYFRRCAIRFAFALQGLRFYPRTWRDRLRERLPVTEYGGRRLTDRAVAYLRTEADTPLFLYVHYMDVHYPYVPHPELGPEPSGLEPASLPALQRGILAGTGAPPSPAQVRFLRTRYAGELPILDGHLDRLLRAWDERFGDDSLVVVTADHGEEFLEHGNFGHGTSLHVELVHVPLILRLPRTAVPETARRGRVDVPVGLVDLVPTVLDAIGLGIRDPLLDGRSWLPYLRGGAGAPARGLLAVQDRWGRRSLRWRRGDLVLLEEADGDAVRAVLHDLGSDRAERYDLAAARPDDLAALRQEATPARAAFDAVTGDRGSDANPVATDGLRALGYVD